MANITQQLNILFDNLRPLLHTIENYTTSHPMPPSHHFEWIIIEFQEIAVQISNFVYYHLLTLENCCALRAISICELLFSILDEVVAIYYCLF